MTVDAAGTAASARLLRSVHRITATARNLAEVIRFGGLRTDEQASPYTVEAEQFNYRLRHYFSRCRDEQATPAAPAILLVPPLMLTSEVWDVSANTSAVASLHGFGLDPWVVDFGRPDREPGGLQRTFSDHVLAVSDAIDRVTEATGRTVVLAGYSQGGMFVYQAAALRRGKDIDSLVTFGSPVDYRAPVLLPLAPDVAVRLARAVVGSGLLRRITLPAWAARLGFTLLTPVKSAQERVRFLLALHDRESLLAREGERRFIGSTGWTSWSGPAIAELLEQFVIRNRMVEGGFEIDGRLVSLADIALPVFTVVGALDTIGHPDSVRAIRTAAPRADVHELTLRTGHLGLVVGSTATEHTWPAVAEWTWWRQGVGELSAEIRPAVEVESTPLPVSSGAVAFAQAAELGVGAARIAFGAARQVVQLARTVWRPGEDADYERVTSR